MGTSKSYLRMLYVLLFVMVIISFIYLIQKYRNSQHVESYVSTSKDVDLSNTSSIINTFLREHGFDSVSSLYNFTQGNYNEDFSPIMEDKTLTVYYSVFSTDSIPTDESRKFNNISPYFKNVKDTSSKYLQYEKSYLEFYDAPYAARNMGIELLTNTAVGPPSHLMGIQGNGTFTIFMALRFNGFSTNNALDYEVFKLYGNTDNNNAISLTIDALPKSRDTNSAEVRFKLNFATQTGIPTSFGGVDHFRIDHTRPYLIVVTKMNNKISMNIHDLSKDVSIDSSFKLIENVELEEPNAFFSNRGMAINSFDNMNANMFTFGMYKMYIMDESALHHYLHTEIYKSSEAFLREARQILMFQQEIEMAKACPYDETVCKACSDVKDWTKIGNGVLESSTECRQAIDRYCSENLDDPKCACWRPANRSSIECQSYLNIFKSVQLVDPENLDDESRSYISTRYNLCNCEDLDALREEVKRLKTGRTQGGTGDSTNVTKNELPPVHQLTSPYLDSGPVSYSDEKEGQCKTSPSLLSNLPAGTLPDISNARLSHIANASVSYKGEDDDDENYNKRLEMDRNPYESVKKSADYRYGETEFQQGKGFWAWLLGR